jgi:predicted DNA binding CopG/RHH family protein
MRNKSTIENLESLIAAKDFKRAQKELIEFMQEINRLEREIKNLRGEKVSKTPKDATINLRLNSKELEVLKKLAKKEGINTSEFIRNRVPEMSISA